MPGRLIIPLINKKYKKNSNQIELSKLPAALWISTLETASSSVTIAAGASIRETLKIASFERTQTIPRSLPKAGSLVGASSENWYSRFPREVSCRTQARRLRLSENTQTIGASRCTRQGNISKWIGVGALFFVFRRCWVETRRRTQKRPLKSQCPEKD